VQYESRAIEREGAERGHISLNMGAGDLKVSSGTQALMHAYFTYNVPALKPVVHSSIAGGMATISINQAQAHGHASHLKYEWDLRVNDEIPMDLDIHLGAGQGQLDLGRLALRTVNVAMGVGQLQLDLRGQPKHDYIVTVNGGVGEADVRLPNNVGIEATATGGIGDISVRGLSKEGGRWINDAFRSPGVKVRVDVHGGVGTIKLTAE
jgi:hypothetical protein